MNRFDIAEAHAVLEWDYNLGGWLRERPSNQRRMEATAVQLNRLKFRARPNLSFDTLEEDGKLVYLANVLRWKLPRDEEQNQLIRELFDPAWLKLEHPSVFEELYAAEAPA